MDKLFHTILELSFRGCFVIGAVLLARLLLKKAPAVCRYALWGLVAVALLVPFRFESALSLIPSAPQAQTQAVTPPPASPEDTEVPVGSPGPVLQPEAPLSRPTEEKQTVSFRLKAAHIWLAGVAAMAIWAGIGWLRLREKVRASVRLRENVYLCDHIPSPFVFGVFQPRIYLPSELPEEQRDLVLAHERGHIFRWDHAARLLGWAVLAVHWYNPLVWLAFVLFCRDMEMACDEWVIRELDRKEIRRYSEALISCGVSRGGLSFHHLAFGEVSIQSRVKNILSYKKPTLWITLAAVAVAAVVAVCFLTERPAPEVQQPAVQETGEQTEATQPDAPDQATVLRENPGFQPPLELTGALSPEDARATADFRDGSGYGFFDYEAEELVRLLNALTEEDFLYEPEISSVLSVTLTASGRDVYLESDTDLVVLEHQGVRWGIRDEELSRFFRVLYSVTDYEEYNVAPLGELRENYNMEEAMIDLCVIQEDGTLRYNAEVWDAFYTDCLNGTPATVRIWERNDGVTCVRDLEFDGNTYCLYWYENGQLCTQRWEHLHCFSGDTGEGSHDRYCYNHYILTDDPACTWDEQSHSLHHSRKRQNGNGGHHADGHHGESRETYSGHHRVCSRYTYYPDHPDIPCTPDKAELVLDGAVMLTTTVPESLTRLEVFFREAEETYTPKTYNLGPELWLSCEGRTVAIQLDLNNDLCVIDGVFYDYGPGYTDEGSYNALPALLACFNLTEWPQPVKDQYGEYIWW